MSVEKHTCPICGANNPIDSPTCAICGTKLTRRPLDRKRQGTTPLPAADYYDPAMGEDDLLITRATGGRWLTFGVLLLGCIAAALILYFGANYWQDRENDAEMIADTTTPTFTPTLGTVIPTLPPTNTRIPPTPLPTITPTITLTPTPDGCMVEVKSGDTLYQLALACGHQHLDVVPLIVEENGLACDTCQQIGQILKIPFPTPTDVPPGSSSIELAAAPGETGGGSETAGTPDEISAEEIIATRQAAAEPTLDPNMMWHTITEGQTLYEVVSIYNIDVKLLSEINPEIEFAQCDFGVRFGGETCSVIFSVGQRLRVPAPTPTPTIPPTLSGSETPTPTATATFNVPELFAPENGRTFDPSRIVALRWTTTGSLGVDEVYVVRVKNRETDEVFTAITCDQAFDLPRAWRPSSDEPTEYEWWISVARVGTGITASDTSYIVHHSLLDYCDLSLTLPIDWDVEDYQTDGFGVLTGIAVANERYPTQPRYFIWQGRG